MTKGPTLGPLWTEKGHVRVHGYNTTGQDQSRQSYSFVQWSNLVDGCQVVSSQELSAVEDDDVVVATVVESLFSMTSCAPVVSDTPEQDSRTTQSLPWATKSALQQLVLESNKYESRMLGRLHEDGNVGSFVQALYPGDGCQIDPQLELAIIVIAALIFVVVVVVVAAAAVVVVVVVVVVAASAHTSSSLQDLPQEKKKLLQHSSAVS